MTSSKSETILHFNEKQKKFIPSNSIMFQDAKSISTTSITIIEHSENSFFSSQKKISGKSAKQLAEDISKKYTGDKTKLKDINLIACELGMSIDGRCFAQDFLKEMQVLGFTNLKVHAIANPQNVGVTDMVVETYVINNKMQLSAFCYTSKKNAERDNEIEMQLQKDAQESNLSSEKRNALLKERERLRIYVCVNTPYSEALALPQNKFSGEVQKPEAIMTPEVAYAITFLKNKYDKLSVKEKTKGNEAPYLKRTIDGLQKNPKYNLEKIENLLKNEKPSWTGNIKKYDNIISELKNEVTSKLDSKNKIKINMDTPQTNNNTTKINNNFKKNHDTLNKTSYTKNTRNPSNSNNDSQNKSSTNFNWSFFAFIKYLIKVFTSFVPYKKSEINEKVKKLESKDITIEQFKSYLVDEMNKFLHNNQELPIDKKKLIQDMRDYLLNRYTGSRKDLINNINDFTKKNISQMNNEMKSKIQELKEAFKTVVEKENESPSHNIN